MGNNYTPDNSAAGGIALAHTIRGEHISGNVALVNSAKATGVDTIKQATGYSTAPYRPPTEKVPKVNKGGGSKPKNRLPKRQLCKANEHTCKGFATKTGYCVGHSRSMGLIQNWNKDGRLDAEEQAKKNLEFKTAQDILGAADEPD